MIESSDDTHNLRSSPTSHRRRNRFFIYCLSATLILLVFILVAVILAFTLFRPRDPTILILSARVAGVLPGVAAFPTIALQLNVTLQLSIRAHNPNRAAFFHVLGRTELYYRGVVVGAADLDPGWISPMGDEDLVVVLTVQADRFSSEIPSLVADVLAGEVGFDAATRVPGHVTVLGFIEHPAVALSQCHVAIGFGFPDLKVEQQQCTQTIKL